jgi:hypothetical protein
MRPLIAKLIEKVEFSKWTQNPTHKPALAYGAFDRVKPAPDNILCAHNTRDGTRHFAENIVRTSDSALTRCKRLRDMLGRLKTRVYERHRRHPQTMLYCRWEHSNLGEDALVRWPREDLVLVALGAAVKTDKNDRGAQVLDKVPACAGDCEEIVVCADVAKDVESCVVLEEQVHFDADAADVLEHVGELHMFRVGAKAVESEFVSFFVS